MRSCALPFVIVLATILGVFCPETRAAEPVPPVPYKKDRAAPKEGFSTARLRLSPPGAPDGGARAPLGAKAALNILVIRVAFSDTPIESSTAYYDRLLLFQKQYWEQVTEGQRLLNHTLLDSVFTLPHPMSYYGDDERFQERLVFMVRDLVQLADSTVDFAPYQSLMIFHAGHGQEADVLDDSREEIWSAFVTKEDFKAILPDSTGAVGIRTNDLLGSSPKYIDEAVEVPEVESQDGYKFGMVGVICHEFGHQLGLPDLYDTNGSEGGDSQGVASWDVMGTGVWNDNGYAPAEISAWSRLFLGLIPPLRVVSDQAVAISMLERQVDALPRIVQIPMTESEYLLIENRRQDMNGNGKFDFDNADGDTLFDFYGDSYAGAEYDFFLPGEGQGSGIVIYHVDEAVIAAYLKDNLVNAFAGRKGIDVVEADGVEDLDGPPSSFSSGSPDDVFRAGWRDKLTPTTSPSTAAYGNVLTGISITGISAADSVMTFAVSFEREKAGWPKLLSGRIGSAPALAATLGGPGPPFSQELIVPVQRPDSTGAIYVFRADGTDYLDLDATPTPFATTATGVVTSPCVGDIDGQLGNEIVFGTRDGTIYAFHVNGTEVVDGDSNPLTTGVLLRTGRPSRAQPVLAELDGTPGLEILVGSAENVLGFSLLRAIRVGGGTVEEHTIYVGGNSELPPVAADVDGDGVNEVLATARVTQPGENSYSGLYFGSWAAFTDSILPSDPENLAAYAVVSGGPFSAPVAADLDRDGLYEIIVADLQGFFHAYRLAIAAHGMGDPPASYVSVSELTGWPTPFPGAPRGSLAELSVADLEQDGHPEVFQTGVDVRVIALEWSGAVRSGFPIRARAPDAPADSEGVWAPLVADVDGNGSRKDVIPILPDGRRPAYHGDGQPIPAFVELGSTGVTAPPIVADLEGDGPTEWIETFDADSILQVSVREPILPIAAASVAWGQYRLLPTRNAVVAPSAPAPGVGTQGVADVYVYPNPSRSGESRIHYRLDAAATNVSIRIYDSAGGLVAEVPTGAADLLGSSEHAVLWNNRPFASGIYLCRIEVQSSAGTEVRFTTLGVLR